jgi:hypothetical protein
MMKAHMRALSIRQPYAELILRGIKTMEIRTLPTRIVGQRFHIYAPLKKAPVDQKVWSRDLAMPGAAMPDWLVELAEQVKMVEPGALLPVGVIVGSAVIERCSPLTTSNGSTELAAGSSTRLAAGGQPGLRFYAWHLADVERATKLRKPTRRPQPVWF